MKGSDLLMEEKICKFCNKPFIPNSNNQIYCKRPHYHKCPVCGKISLVTNNEKLKRPPTACSYPCRVKRTQQTSLKKYGMKAPGNNPEARKKAQITMTEKYGGRYTLECKELTEQVKKTCIEKYGVTNPGSNPDVIAKRMKTNKDKYGDKLPFNLPECYEKQHKTMMERYGVPYYCITEHCMHASGQAISKINLTFQHKLNKLGIESRLEEQIGQKFYDIYIPDTKIAIEINPTYTHNYYGNHWDSKGLPKNYHLEKYQIAKEQDIRCIHVWDWDDWNTIINMVKNKQKLSAHKFKIFLLDDTVSARFLNEYSINKAVTSPHVSYGLIKDGELYQVMCVGKPKYDKTKSCEILRLCTRPGYSIVGGGYKLWNYIMSIYEFDSVVSYCDISKFSGNIYNHLGLKLDHYTDPKKIWSKGKKYITDHALRMKYKQYSDNRKDVPLEQQMVDKGWLPVYDCGIAVYTMR